MNTSCMPLGLALRVVALDKLSPNRVIPEEYFIKAIESEGEALNTESIVH